MDSHGGWIPGTPWSSTCTCGLPASRNRCGPSIALYFTDKKPAKFPIVIQMENDPGLDIPAGRRDFLVSDDFKLPLDADLLALYPHAHYLGQADGGLRDAPRRRAQVAPQNSRLELELAKRLSL